MFSLFTRKKVYKAEELHAGLITIATAYATQLGDIKKKELEKVPQTLNSEYTKLVSLGLGNTRNAKILKSKLDEIYSLNKVIEDFNEQVKFTNETIKFMHYLGEVFGPKTLLVRFDDFEKIVNKYNLVCGDINQYTGSIPSENIEDISNVLTSLKLLKLGRTEAERFLDCAIRRIYTVDTISTKDKLSKSDIERINRFPYAIIKNSSLFLPSCPTLDDRNFRVNICSRVFIAAPVQEMDTPKVKFSDRIQSEDPFICSYSPYGIVIYSKWGTEAEDDILKKYYDLIK